MSQDSQNKSIRIFVGLGGFGSTVVQKLYKRAIEKGGGTQPPSHLKFVTYDSAMHEKKSYEEFPNAVDFMGANPEMAQDYLNRKRESLSDMERWWPGIYSEKNEKMRWNMSDLRFTGQGLGQFRPFGRLGFFYHLDNQNDDLIRLVDKVFLDAVKVEEGNAGGMTARIILVNSLAGGTGSSSFLDVAHLLKSQLDRSSVSNFQLMLFTVTGDAAMHKRTKIQNDSYKLALSNTYAALTELDYWMDSDPAKKDTMEYPKYGKVEQNPPLFNQCNVICLDNQNGRTLSNWRSYLDYVTNLLDVLEIKSETSGTFNSLYDNILTYTAVAQSRYASMATGAIIYPYRDALEYVYSFLAEDVLEELVLQADKSQVKSDLKNELGTTLGLDEKGYFGDGTSSINYDREDQVFDKLEDPWTNEFEERHDHPQVSLGLLNQKLNLENVQTVTKNIESYRKELRKFYSFSKQDVYDSIISSLESRVFYGAASISLGYMREYLKELKGIIDSRIKGLEKYIPELFEEKEYTSARDKYASAKAELERKTKKRNLRDFQPVAERYMRAMELVEKSKAKRDIYEKLSLQLEWYLKAVEELQVPLEGSVLKHYKSIRSGLELGTYSNYEREDFNIEALSVQDYKEDYRKYYQDIDEERAGEIERVKSRLKSQLLHLLSKDKSGDVGDKSDRMEALELWKKYTITPQWSSQESTSQNTRVRLIDRDDQVRLKDHMRQLFDSIMEDEFKEMTTGILPKNVIEALYKESKIMSRERKKRLSDLLKEKLNQLEALVTPFVVVTQRTDALTEGQIAVERSDVDDLFQHYSDDHQLREDADEIYEALSMDRKAGAIGSTKPAHSDRISMINVFGKFELQHIAPYERRYKEANLNQTNSESFTDIRLKSGKSTEEILFLLAEYYGIIDSKGAIFKFRGDTLDKGLRGRQKNLTWFLEDRDSNKISDIKKELKAQWLQISPQQRKSEFEKLITFLRKGRQSSKDEDLRKLYDDHIKSVDSAIDSKVYESIDNFMS